MHLKGFSLTESNNKELQRRVCFAAEEESAHDAASPFAAEANANTHTGASKCKTNHNNHQEKENMSPFLVTPKKYHLTTTHQANQEHTQKMMEKQQFTKVSSLQQPSCMPAEGS